MNLEALVEKVRKFGDNQMIVDFNNGYSVAYEKFDKLVGERPLLQTQFFEVNGVVVLPQLIPPCASVGYGFEWGVKSDLGNKRDYFSPEFWRAIREYKSKSFERSGDLDAKTKQLYRKMVEPLEMETFRSKYWGSAIALACFPLLVFAGMFFGAVPCIESMSAASREQDFYRIKNKSLLKKKSDGKSPAIYEDWRLQIDDIPKIKPNKINAYWGASLLFPSQNDVFIHLAQSRPAFVCHKSDKKRDGESSYDWSAKLYNASKYYLSVDETLGKELYATVGQKEAEIASWQHFKYSLTKENQIALLQSVGFI